MRILCSTFLVLAMSTAGIFAQSSATLRQGDLVEIRLGGVPAEFGQEVSSSYTVDDQGNLSLPFIPPVHVAGLTVSQAQTAIETKYKADEIYTTPTIIITQQSSARFVIVGGAIKAPGRLAYTSDLTLMSAINAAGGLTEFGKEKGVTIIRGGKVQAYDLRKLKKDPSQDPAILPGDQINVPQSSGLW